MLSRDPFTLRSLFHIYSTFFFKAIIFFNVKQPQFTKPEFCFKQSIEYMYIVVRYIAIALLDLSLNGRSFAFHLANIDPKKLDGGTFTRETAAFSFFLFSAPAAT